MTTGFELLLIGFTVGASFCPVNALVLKSGIGNRLHRSIYAASGALLDTPLCMISSSSFRRPYSNN